LSPPHRALVLSVDEKSQIQALDREQPVLYQRLDHLTFAQSRWVTDVTTLVFAAKKHHASQALSRISS